MDPRLDADPRLPRRRGWGFRIGVVVASVGAAVTLVWAMVWRVVHQPASPDNSLVSLTIPRGQSSTAIGKTLQAAGLIKSPGLFVFYAYLTGASNRLQAGEYHLPRHLSLAQVVERLGHVQRRRELTLTIVEGWSNRELAEYLIAQGVTNAEEFSRVVQANADWWDAYAFLPSRPAASGLEGYLFPDTYRVFVGSPLEALVSRMLDNFERKLTPALRAEISRQGKPLQAVVTLASIIEREVPHGPDRAKIAGIFLRRLALGMPLQADATVNYVTGKKTPRPSLDDIKTKSVYNTYIHRGLPPGPINNPGLSAMTAALFPEPSVYLYYLTTPDGAVIYSRTHDEHVAAKARYYP